MTSKPSFGTGMSPLGSTWVRRAGIALLLGLVATLTACGGSGGGSGGATGQPQEALAPITVREMNPAHVGTLASGMQAVMSELLVTMRVGVTEQAAMELFTRHGLTVVGKVPEAMLYQLALASPVPEGQLQELRDRLAAEPNVSGASLNVLMRTTGSDSPAVDDLSYEDQSWATKMIKAEQAWQRLTSWREGGKRFSTVRVGIIDSGFANCPDEKANCDIVFAKRYGPGGQENEASSDPWPLAVPFPSEKEPSSERLKEYHDAKAVRDHGMHVAGIIGARGNNGQLVAGVAWPVPLELYAAKIDGSGAVILAQLARLVRDDARVLNLSIGPTLTGESLKTGTPDSNEFNRIFGRLMVSLLARKDFLLVVAAGNDGADAKYTTYLGVAFEEDECPVYFGVSTAECKRLRDSTLIVGGTRSETLPFSIPMMTPPPPKFTLGDDDGTGSSNYGKAVHIAAPGGERGCGFVNSATDPRTYKQNTGFANACAKYGIASLGANLGQRVLLSGTSMAAPFVTGAASVLLAVNPKLTASQVKDILVSKTSRNADDRHGALVPFLDIDQALTAAAVADGGTLPARDTSKAPVIFSLVCRSFAGGTVTRVAMQHVPVRVFRRVLGMFEVETLDTLVTTGSTGVSGAFVTDLAAGNYYLRTDATSPGPGIMASPKVIKAYFTIDPTVNSGIRTIGRAYEPSGSCGELNTDTPLTEINADNSPITEMATVPEGMFGHLFGWRGGCDFGDSGCTLFANADITYITGDTWRGETWRSTNLAPFVKMPNSAPLELGPTGWVRLPNEGIFVRGADGISRTKIAGVDTAVKGRIEDIAGLPMSYVGETGSHAGTLLPAGSVAYRWEFTTTDDIYELFVPFIYRDAGVERSHPTLDDMAATFATPAPGVPLVRSLGWDGFSMTFDGPLAASGTLTMWSPFTRLAIGKGQYEQRVIKGQTVLVVLGADLAALTEAARFEPRIYSDYIQGRRRMYSVAEGLVHEGEFSPAGTYQLRPSLNRVALDGVLAARGLCKLPAANGSSDCSAVPPPRPVSFRFTPSSPAQIEIDFDRPMSPTFYTTGSHVAEASFWVSPTRFVMNFSSYTPGDMLTLVAPTALDSRGFRSASGMAMGQDAGFRFP